MDEQPGYGGSTGVESLQHKIEMYKRKCAVCGWEWLKMPTRPEPKRCPNHECRSPKWKSTEMEVAPDEC